MHTHTHTHTHTHKHTRFYALTQSHALTLAHTHTLTHTHKHTHTHTYTHTYTHTHTHTNTHTQPNPSLSPIHTTQPKTQPNTPSPLLRYNKPKHKTKNAWASRAIWVYVFRIRCFNSSMTRVVDLSHYLWACVVCDHPIRSHLGSSLAQVALL